MLVSGDPAEQSSGLRRNRCRRPRAAGVGVRRADRTAVVGAGSAERDVRRDRIPGALVAHITLLVE
jgi:hypothetical protein